jgi:hypothetical protein
MKIDFTPPSWFRQPNMILLFVAFRLHPGWMKNRVECGDLQTASNVLKSSHSLQRGGLPIRFDA